MTVTSRIDAMARGLAVRSAADEPLDCIARAMATPISRRRAFRLAAAAAGTSMFALRTGTAHACASCPQPLGPQELTQFCGYPVGVGCKFACCYPRDECCKAPGGVKCCKPYEGFGCGPIVNDIPTCECKNECGEYCCTPEQECVTPEFISDPGDVFCAEQCPWDHCFASDAQGRGSVFCCQGESNCCGTGCCDPEHTCCGRDPEGSSDSASEYCCPWAEGMSCGANGGCGCTALQECGRRCCPRGQICESERFGDCLGPDLEDVDELLELMQLLISGAPAAGGSASTSRRRSAKPAAAPGSTDALVAIGAVANLGALARDRLSSSPPDRAYRHPVNVLKPKLAPLVAGPGLDASAAQALHRLLSAEARAWALVNAAAVARCRSLGAIRARDLRAARSQARAYGRFAGRAAKALRRVPALRAAAAAALQASGAPEVTVTQPQAVAFRNSVRRSGLPADMRARLAQLGLRRADQRRIAKLVVARRSASGPILIAPLTDASRRAAITRLAKLFKQVAARSRKRPLVSSKGGPRTVPGVRPHASKSSGRRRG